MAMIIGIGTDIIEVKRIERLIGIYGERFFNRIFTENEREYCDCKPNPSIHYSARFAGKESVLKALGTGLGRNIHWKDIEIVSQQSGQPQVRLFGNARKIVKNFGETKTHISISHTDNYALTMVIVEKI
ncbi:holo-ACP synthase [bacterium]|nr:holo-ACP synthase [bacterium]